LVVGVRLLQPNQQMVRLALQLLQIMAVLPALVLFPQMVELHRTIRKAAVVLAVTEILAVRHRVGLVPVAVVALVE
jgi:hypothetical protein